VSDRVNKSVVLLVSPDLSKQEDGIQYQAGNNDGKENYAEYQQYNFAKVQQYPADVERS